jgi:GxxExxY protein
LREEAGVADDELLVDEEMEPDPELNRITNLIIGAAIAVHRALGPGFIEATYQRAMEIELAYREIEFDPQHQVKLYYRDQIVGFGEADLLVCGEVIVELKAVDKLAPVHSSQLLSYLRATKRKLGLLINFNVKALKDGIRRIAN